MSNPNNDSGPNLKDLQDTLAAHFARVATAEAQESKTRLLSTIGSIALEHTTNEDIEQILAQRTASEGGGDDE